MVANFDSRYNFPQCLGAIGGTHIEIKRPNENSQDYMNRKQNFLINVQAACDYRFCFFDVVVKWPESVHDARIFANSNISKCLRDGRIPPCPAQLTPNSMPVPVYLLGPRRSSIPAPSISYEGVCWRRINRSGTVLWATPMLSPHGNRVRLWKA